MSDYDDIPLRQPELRHCSLCGQTTERADYHLHCLGCWAEDTNVPDAAHWRRLTDEAEIENREICHGRVDPQAIS